MTSTGSQYADGYLAAITAVREALDRLQLDVRADVIDATEFDPRPDPATTPAAQPSACWLVGADADDAAITDEVTGVATWLLTMAQTRTTAEVLTATTAISDDRQIGELLSMLVLVAARR